MKRTPILAFVLLLIGATALPAAATPAAVSQDLTTPAHVELDATALECDNRGSTVEFSGTLTLGGLTVKLTFKNNWKGTHTLVTTGTANLEVTPAIGNFEIPKQPVLGGVGGNPWLSFQFTDDKGKPISERILLGRCVQGTKLAHISRDLPLSGVGKAFVKALDCSNKGSKISLSTSHARGALNGTLFLDNNINKVVHEWSTAASIKVGLFPAVVIPKQGSLGGPGGNPIISLQFVGAGGALGDEIELGRCVKLG